MARKVFISFLGTGPANNGYEKGRYKSGVFISNETKFIQTATLDWIKEKEGVYPDCSYILLTKESKEVSWEELKNEFDNKKISYQTVENLPKGKNEIEIRNIFAKIEEFIEDGDELYLDLTHGFRYMPMILLIVSHLSTITKKTIVKHVSYGSFLTRETSDNLMTGEIQIAPIVDLLPLIKLLDNTNGIAVNNATRDYFNHPTGKDKITILICGQTAEKEEKLKKTLKNILADDLFELDLIFELGYDELKNSSVMSQIDSNRFDFIIAGPMPHSIKGKRISQGLEKYCTDNRYKTKVFVKSDSELSKTHIQEVAKKIKTNINSKIKFKFKFTN